VQEDVERWRCIREGFSAREGAETAGSDRSGNVAGRGIRSRYSSA
jgi:hypothetical protein